MLVFDERLDGRVGCDEAVVAIFDRANLAVGRRTIDLPMPVAIDEREVDDADVLAEVVTHHRGYAAHESAGVVDFAHRRVAGLGIGWIGKDRVRVAEQHHIDAGHAREVPGRVLGVRAVRRRVEAAVHERDDDVGTGLAQLGNILLRRFDDADRVHLAFEIALVPFHDAGRREADHADAQVGL